MFSLAMYTPYRYKKIIFVNIITLSIIFLASVLFFNVYFIPSDSMSPTLKEGDLILLFKNNNLFNKRNFKYKRGDIIIFRQKINDVITVKRVIGLPADNIFYKEKKIYINSKEIKQFNVRHLPFEKQHDFLMWEKIDLNKYQIYMDYGGIYNFNELQIPINEYYVMGDNRDKSHDSRYFGTINRNGTVGKVIAILTNYNRQEHKLIFNRTRFI
jgi:signal peptidase I